MSTYYFIYMYMYKIYMDMIGLLQSYNQTSLHQTKSGTVEKLPDIQGFEINT
jgi:hypothetical protein